MAARPTTFDSVHERTATASLAPSGRTTSVETTNDTVVTNAMPTPRKSIGLLSLRRYPRNAW
jgi:hypothetical protein